MYKYGWKFLLLINNEITKSNVPKNVITVKSNNITSEIIDINKILKPFLGLIRILEYSKNGMQNTS